MKINVSIFGVSGYTGTQLVSLLVNHKNVNIVAVFGNETLGKNLSDLFPNIDNIPNIKISDYKKFNFNNCDLVFLCLPHYQSQRLIKSLKSCRVIDLSADYRIRDGKKYKIWYEKEHLDKKMLKKFTYGLSEINRKKIKKSRYIANPGCYPTSVLIPLIPLFKEKIVEEDSIIIDSKSGVSGAGKNPSVEKLFFEINENFYAYNIEKHRHLGEIEQEIKLYQKSVNITFTPHLLPISRGILSTIYIRGNNKNFIRVQEFLKEYYSKDFFVKFLPSGKVPTLRMVNGTNNILIGLFQDFNKKNIIIVTCIDNLIKGAAGQAIQNMNIMFGFDEKESLILKKIIP
jgi:N-acetyl-gamma-glutamyl-phosphate reductase